MLPNNGGAIAGLKTSGMNVDPRAGNLSFQPAPVPNIIEDATHKSVQNFMSESANAAFNYAQREAKFQADEAALAYSEEARKAFAGHVDEGGKFVPGYASSTGKQAVGMYEGFEQQLEERFNEALENMEPRVRQHAIMQMQGQKNTWLNKGATHRVQQLKKAEEDQRIQKQAALISQIVTDPTLVVPNAAGQTRVFNPHTKQTVKEMFYSEFTSVAAADKAWVNVLRQTAEGIADMSAAQGRQFLTQVTNQMLDAGEPGLEAFTSAQNTIRSREQHEENLAAQKHRNAIMLGEKELKKLQSANTAFIRAQFGTPNQFSAEQINEYAMDGRINERQQAALLAPYKQYTQSAPPETVRMWTDYIGAAEKKADGFFYTKVWDAEKGKHVSMQLTMSNILGMDQAISLDPDAQETLAAYIKRREKPDFKMVQRVMDNIQASWEKDIAFEFNKAGKAAFFQQIEDELFYEVERGNYTDYIDLENFARNKRKFYNDDAVTPLDMLRNGAGIRNWRQPNDIPDAQAHLKFLRQNPRPEREWRLEVRETMMWIKSMQQAEQSKLSNRKGGR